MHFPLNEPCGDHTPGRTDYCGFDGDDLLAGGDGKDKLLGQKDKDRCAGGGGGDKAEGCEKKSGIP